MYPTYRDIRERLGEPKWHDRSGVPRYSDFTPKEAGEIYCNWVAAMTIQCQSCGREFLCANALSSAHLVIQSKATPEQINDERFILGYLICWGDAPWHSYPSGDPDGQCAGTTMTTGILDVRVWHKPPLKDWELVDRDWSEYHDDLFN